jgi:membrane-bound metal-dependent hydrolase YbcI (DUF457 family)
MLGHTHAISGTVTGLAAGAALLHLAAPPLALFTGLVTAYALAPDLDKCGSTEARSFGFITEIFAWIVETVSGGHRHGTHSIIGILAFLTTALLAVQFRATLPGKITLAVILVVGFASAWDALHLPAKHLGSVIACAGAAMMILTGYGLSLVAIAAAAGTATHIAGDMLTREGCPLAWPMSRKNWHLTPGFLRFTTGTWPEHLIVTPVLVFIFCVLIYRDVSSMPMVAQAPHAASHMVTHVGIPAR